MAHGTGSGTKEEHSGLSNTTKVSAASMHDFDAFLTAHPDYRACYDALASESRKLAMAAAVVYHLHAADLERVTPEILGYVTARYGSGAAQRYVERCRRLEQLQARFDAAPSIESLGGNAAAIARDDYNLALLLSIVFTNHRFEIMQRLSAFLTAFAPSGRLAGIGTGTGYEVLLSARTLPGWALESYDINAEAEAEAKRLLAHFAVAQPVDFGREFPLNAIDNAFRGRYDALLACEVLEHLPDPLNALRSMREYLTAEGRIFATMAVNIAQEDHIFWYPDLASCRMQAEAAGLRIVEEWITPQTTLPPPPDRTRKFHRGNYVAVLARA